MRNNRNYWPNDDFQADGSPAPGDIRLVPKYADLNESPFLVLKNPFGPDPIIIAIALDTEDLNTSILGVYSVPLTIHSPNKYRALPKVRFTVNINVLSKCELSNTIEIDSEMVHRVWWYTSLTKLAEEETYNHPLYVWNNQFYPPERNEMTTRILSNM
jgi:hypothetical protein